MKNYLKIISCQLDRSEMSEWWQAVTLTITFTISLISHQMPLLYKQWIIEVDWIMT